MTTSHNRGLQELRDSIPHIDVGGAVAHIVSGAVLLDVCEPDETASGIAPWDSILRVAFTSDNCQEHLAG